MVFPLEIVYFFPTSADITFSNRLYPDHAVQSFWHFFLVKGFGPGHNTIIEALSEGAPVPLFA